jgi:hypothetical protein
MLVILANIPKNNANEEEDGKKAREQHQAPGYTDHPMANMLDVFPIRPLYPRCV